MSGETVIGKWKLGKELGSGHFAKVRLGEHIETKAKCAVKVIKKPQGAKQQLVKNEVDILKAVKHPYIVQCYDVEETESKVYLFMELMSGGELFDRIVDKGHFTEKVRRAPRCAARRAPGACAAPQPRDLSSAGCHRRLHQADRLDQVPALAGDRPP